MRLVEGKGNNLLRQLKEIVKKCLYFSIALDGSSDARNTAHLPVFMRRLNEKFEVVDESLSMEALKSTTGEELHRRMPATLILYEISWNKLMAVTTYGSLNQKDIILGLLNRTQDS
jgi:hypothetical protein